MAENNFEAAPEGGIRVAGSADAPQPAPAEEVAKDPAPEAEKLEEESSDTEESEEGEESGGEEKSE